VKGAIMSDKIAGLKADGDLQNPELMNYFLKLAELNSNLETIVDLIEKTNEAESEINFLNLILNKAFNLVPEADYGRIVVNYQDTAYFLEKIYRDELLDFETKNFQSQKNNRNSNQINFKSQQLNKKLIINLKLEQQFMGAVILYISSENYKNFSSQSVKIASVLEKIASSYLTAVRYQKLQEKFKEEIIVSLSNLLAIHDQYTEGHNQKVAKLSKNLAQAAGLNSRKVKKAYWSGLLHDIGKTLIPVSILTKKGGLTEAEYEKIKKHPEWAYRTLKDSTELKDIAKYVLHHHEKWDGSGYPDQLVGAEIPLISQILAIADAWDAMTSNRSYRKALSQKEAVKRLKNNQGKQFSPRLTDLFLDNIS
jgi:HD-GYP domain-containing protein (c-di-GMP phosphodiesterase class II)